METISFQGKKYAPCHAVQCELEKELLAELTSKLFSENFSSSQNLHHLLDEIHEQQFDHQFKMETACNSNQLGAHYIAT